ncbi:hypothetical protein [Streptomyces lavendulae]|uniref:hypothetical protein n=1 Tax=Streptomyces lavendulae TaxID=1914 RepID=UPI0033D1D1A1
MSIDRSALTGISILSALAGVIAAWSALRNGGDPATLGLLAFACTSMLLGKLNGASALNVLVRSALLVAGGAVLLVGLLLARTAGSAVSLTTA